MEGSCGRPGLPVLWRHGSSSFRAVRRPLMTSWRCRSCARGTAGTVSLSFHPLFRSWLSLGEDRSRDHAAWRRERAPCNPRGDCCDMRVTPLSGIQCVGWLGGGG